MATSADGVPHPTPPSSTLLPSSSPSVSPSLPNGSYAGGADGESGEFTRSAAMAAVNGGSSERYGGGALPTSGITAVELESLEHRFVSVMRELAMEPQLEPFTREYERLHRLLNKSHEGELRLLGKVRELHDELATHHNKIDTAVQLSQEDEQSIALLRKEIERAWAMADSAHLREKDSRELIQELKKQVAQLDQLVERSAGLSLGQEAYLRDVLQAQKQLQEEHSVSSAKATRLATEHHATSEELRNAEGAAEAAKAALEHQLTEYDNLLQDLERVRGERAALEQSVREYRGMTEDKTKRMEQQRERMESLAQEEMRLKREAAQVIDSSQSALRQLEDQQAKISAQARRLATAEQHNAELKKELPARLVTLKEKQHELEKLKRVLRSADGAAREQQSQLQALVQERDALMAKGTAYGTEMDDLLAVLAAEEKALRTAEAALKKAMDAKSSTVADNVAKENARAETEGQRVFEEGKRHRLAQELGSMLSANEALRKRVFELEQSQGKDIASAQGVLLAYHKTLDDIRTKRNTAKELRERGAIHEKKQKRQQELLDRVTGDRNRTEKQLRETHEEWQRLQGLHHSKQEELERLKGDLVSTEGSLCQIHVVNKEVQRDIAVTERRADHLQEGCTQVQARVSALQGEARQLQQIIAQCDGEKAAQQARLNAMVNERNVLATQLVRRDEELRLLYDKLALQESALIKGGEDYDACVRTLLAARDELAELRLRCRLMLVRLRYMERLRRREMQGTRTLQQERAKLRGLTDELANPVNVHRWRRLDNEADAALLDDLAKVQLLQKRLVAKSAECEKKLQRIAEKEAEYTALRRKLARLPGPEAAEDLALYDENLSKRSEQIRGMTAELSEVEQHAEVLAEEVKALGGELMSVKQRYFTAKAKHTTLLREQAALRETWGGSSALASLVVNATQNAARLSGSGPAAFPADGVYPSAAPAAPPASSPFVSPVPSATAVQKLHLAGSRSRPAPSPSPSPPLKAGHSSASVGAGGGRTGGSQHKGQQLRLSHSAGGEGADRADRSTPYSQQTSEGTRRFYGRTAASQRNTTTDQQTATARASTGAAGGLLPSMASTQRGRMIAEEEALLHTLSTGRPAPNVPVLKPTKQRQFAGGGFALTR